MAHGVPALHPERKGELNISPKSNWVEAKGGLPPYMNSIATALVKKGMDRSRAIATAVSVCKRTCATGHWNGNPKSPVSAAIKAAACSAVSRWEAMKVSTSMPSEARLAIELARRWHDEDSLEFAWNRMRAKAIIDLAKPKPKRSLRELVRYAIFGPSLD